MQLLASMTVTIHVNVKEVAAVTDILKQLPNTVTNYSTSKTLPRNFQIQG